MLRFGLREKIITTSKRAFVVGILNATPDSFYSGSRGGIDLAFRLIEEGADILDIGAESTRPGSKEIPADEEKKRLLPILKEIRKKNDIPVSVDTQKLEVIKECVAEGADIWNDISALGEECPCKADYAAKERIPVIITHRFPFERENAPAKRDGGIRAESEGGIVRKFDGKNLSKRFPSSVPEVSDTSIIREVSDFFERRISFLEARGIEKAKIIIDPGIGFGKTFSENMTLIKSCGKICFGKYPVMMACSRKRCIGEMIGDMEADRLSGTVEANKAAVESGAMFLRVHDVKEHIFNDAYFH